MAPRGYVAAGWLHPEGEVTAGLQLLGKPFGEETILRLAHAYEQSTPWHREHAL